MCKYVLMPTKNKFTMTDERGWHYFYHPTRHGWYPGRKDRRKFIWTALPNSKCEFKDGVWVFTDGKFRDKPRPYTLPDGTSIRVRLTRYTYDEFIKPAPSPKGRNGQTYKFASRECRREIYYDGEKFWRGANVQRKDGTWLNNTIRPFEGFMWDCWEQQSEEQGIPVVGIWCDGGVPYKVVMDGDEFTVAEGEWEAMYEAVLELRSA